MSYLHSPAWSVKLEVQGDPMAAAMLTRRGFKAKRAYGDATPERP